MQEFIDQTLDRVRRAAENYKHPTLRNAARLLGGIQVQAGFADAEAVQWLLDALPPTVKDEKRAEKTARWGLDVGRRVPIKVHILEKKKADPRRKETTRTAFRLLRMRVGGAELLSALHAQNLRRAVPLPPDVIGKTALWAAEQFRGQQHAR